MKGWKIPINPRLPTNCAAGHDPGPVQSKSRTRFGRALRFHRWRQSRSCRTCPPDLNTADLLAHHRELGRRIRNAALRHSQVRWFVVPKFRNYLIFYQPFEETILVVRVLQAAQDWTRFFPTSQNRPE